MLPRYQYATLSDVDCIPTAVTSIPQQKLVHDQWCLLAKLKIMRDWVHSSCSPHFGGFHFLLLQYSILPLPLCVAASHVLQNSIEPITLLSFWFACILPRNPWNHPPIEHAWGTPNSENRRNKCVENEQKKILGEKIKENFREIKGASKESTGNVNEN